MRTMAAADRTLRAAAAGGGRDAAPGGGAPGRAAAAEGRLTEARRASGYPRAVDRLIGELARLPGIGRRSAERLAFHILKADEQSGLALAAAISDVKKTVGHCPVCWNLSDGGRCEICSDGKRDHSTVLVVEEPRDLIALEQSSMFKGGYHVLMGRLSPLDGIGPTELTIDGLEKRIADPALNAAGLKVREVILGLNPTLEGDGTSLHLAEVLKGKGVKVTRLARGLPTGSSLEYVNKAVLADAIVCRQEVR